MKPKEIAAAIEYNRRRQSLGKMTDRHVALLVAFFQRARKLKEDGKFGPRESLPALEAEARAGLEEPPPPRTYKCRGSGYYPTPDGYSTPEYRLEGGPNDRKGKPLRTLQDFLEGKASYVSCAMDTKAFPYGQKLRIPELEKKYGKPIAFRVVDTGGAFKGKGTTRIDICTRDKRASRDRTINGPLTLVVLVG